jgi:serine/threonine protein kinase
MSSAIETFCQTLARSGLLTHEELCRLLHLWKKQPPGEGSELQRFLGWLMSDHYLTSFQVERLAGGHTGHFYLGRYKLLDRIGVGTMARVYKAVCPDGQLFALKVLTPSRVHDPHWRTLFENEVREAGRFRHPHIVRTFQTGKADGLYYLVMEYLDGETLEEVLSRRGRLPHAEAARLIHQALQGLQHIHEQGSVHCNLEPAHLVLVRSPASGKEDTTLDATVKILDAGLGRTLFDAQVQTAVERAADRGEAQLLGQVDDLAPERAGGGEGDIRADIYSLGCILYHCLAGQPPFPGGTVFDKLIRHSTEAPQPLNEINPDVPEGLQCVVERMMAREPQERYPNPARAAQALIAFLPPEALHGPIPIALPVEAASSMP